ncbi:hypothetical protein G9A89_006462 [Geosiphon pyriformis]|nr:hypothetical protein G9A89_006462 [Geosiphon pyriformis]
MSKTKTPKGIFYGSTDGSFLQKKKVVLGNIKHSGNKKDISLNKIELGGNVFSNVDSLSSNEEGANMADINIGSLLSLAANTLKVKHVNTGAVFGSPLDSPNFSMDNNKEVSLSSCILISLKKKWVDPKIIKTQVEVSVKKFFALDINFLVVKGKLVMTKTQLIRKIFSIINGFEEIIRSIFTSEKSMELAVSLARKKEININSNFKRQGIHSDRAVVIKKISMDMPKEMIVTALAEFDSVHMAMAVRDHETWASKNQFRALLFTLPMKTTAHNLGILLERAGGKTCVIN